MKVYYLIGVLILFNCKNLNQELSSSVPKIKENQLIITLKKNSNLVTQENTVTQLEKELKEKINDIKKVNTTITKDSILINLIVQNPNIETQLVRDIIYRTDSNFTINIQKN